MSQLSEAVALRIALAARALCDGNLKTLLQGLLDQLGEPITEGKLNKLRLSKLKQINALEGEPEACLKAALTYLKGRNIETEPEPLPEIENAIIDQPESTILVACASNHGDQIDGHFGSCRRFLIYQMNADLMRLVDIREPGKVAEDQDKNAIRAQAISDCQVLYTASIGGPAAAKVVRAGLHPIKLPDGGMARDVLQRLQLALADSPPPWLAKVMGWNPEQRIRFKQEASA